MFRAFLSWWMLQPETVKRDTLRDRIRHVLVAEGDVLDSVGRILPPKAAASFASLRRDLGAWE